MKQTTIKKQQGVVLIWALAILLVLTLLGISSMKKATMGTKIAGNSMASMLVFQGAESTLSKITNTYFTAESDQLAGELYTVLPAILPDESVSGGSIKSTGTIMFMQSGECPITNVANGTEIPCSFYRLTAESRLQGTGAKTEHILGVAQMAATTNGYYSQ